MAKRLLVERNMVDIWGLYVGCVCTIVIWNLGSLACAGQERMKEEWSYAPIMEALPRLRSIL